MYVQHYVVNASVRLDVCFADIKFARHVTRIYWMNAEAETEAAAAIAASVHDEQSVSLPSPSIFYIVRVVLFPSFHFILFGISVSIYSRRRFIVVARAHSLSGCTSSPLLQSVFLLLFGSFCSYSSLLTLYATLRLVFSFSARQFLGRFFIIILYYYILFYSVSLMLWLCRMRRRSNAYLLLIHPIEYNTTLTAVCRRILIYLINKFVIFSPRDSLGHPVFLRIFCRRFHCFSIWFISVYTILCIICIPNKQTRLTISIHSFCVCTLTFNLSLPLHANWCVSSACYNVIKSINLLRFIISTCKFANTTKYTNSAG